MKFLCMECDEIMKLQESKGPDAGAMTVIFECPSCGKETAMLTNPMETQMVRSLDLKIGGRSVPAEPIEMVTGSLASGMPKEEEVITSRGDGHHGMHPGTGSEENGESKDASKCPFAGMITDAYEQQEKGITWSEEAEERISRIPSFVQSMVRKSVEQHAREKGYAVIDQKVMDEMKGIYGM